MLHLALTEVVQVRPPLPVLFQIFRYALGEKNVTRVTAIDHALCSVDSRSGDIRSLAYIDNFIHRSVVNTHPDFDFWMSFERRADLQSACRWRFRGCCEKPAPYR